MPSWHGPYSNRLFLKIYTLKTICIQFETLIRKMGVMWAIWKLWVKWKKCFDGAMPGSLEMLRKWSFDHRRNTIIDKPLKPLRNHQLISKISIIVFVFKLQLKNWLLKKKIKPEYGIQKKHFGSKLKILHTTPISRIEASNWIQRHLRVYI